MGSARAHFSQIAESTINFNDGHLFSDRIKKSVANIVHMGICKPRVAYTACCIFRYSVKVHGLSEPFTQDISLTETSDTQSLTYDFKYTTMYSTAHMYIFAFGHG